jgi:hypothetical protein
LLVGIIASAPAAIVQIEHATQALPCSSQGDIPGPSGSIEPKEEGVNPSFDVHVQSVK